MTPRSPESEVVHWHAPPDEDGNHVDVPCGAIASEVSTTIWPEQITCKSCLAALAPKTRKSR